MKPLAVDLCCGLGGWSDGLLVEGWDVVGFDVERHRYGAHQYPAQLVLQDILTLSGHQFRGKVRLIVASPPCQKYSYMAMPWTRAKKLAMWYRDDEHPERIADLTALFDACFRIALEAECPLVVENVRGAQPWVGRSRAAFGSFHLWGDVPALMPMTKRAEQHSKITSPHLWLSDPKRANGKYAPNYTKEDGVEGTKVPTMGAGWYPPDHPKHVRGLAFNGHAERNLREGLKQGGDWFNKASGNSISRRCSSRSKARKAASAHIAKIPLVLAQHIARVYKP